MIFQKKKKILLVDDEPGVLETATLVLESWEFTVFTAKDGKKAVEKAKSQKPDLILLDVGIPVIDGLLVCKILKGNSNTKDIPIILMTGLGKTKEVDEGFLCGADDYVVKPVDWDRLKVKVSKFLESNNS